MRDPLSNHLRPPRRRRVSPRTSPRMTLLDESAQGTLGAGPDDEGPVRLGPYESAYVVTRGYSVDRPIIVPRG